IEDGWKCSWNDDAPEYLEARRAHRQASFDEFLLDSRRIVENQRNQEEDHAHKEKSDLRLVGWSKPNEQQRDKGSGRQIAPRRQCRIEQRPDVAEAAHEYADRHADPGGSYEADENAPTAYVYVMSEIAFDKQYVKRRANFLYRREKLTSRYGREIMPELPHAEECQSPDKCK